MSTVQTTTFKQPFLERVEAALQHAVSISWEGCHKIYIAMDQESHDRQVECGYDPLPVEDRDDAVRQLYDWFEVSCSLRFISAITAGDIFDNVIEQFEYED